MLKKLREYKAKNDGYEHSKRASSIETNDLDLAIQEELNNQIKTLEQRLKEVKQEQDKEIQEKKKLLSRIDVLTAANDRMCEMKEKQDIEVEVCKTKIRELNGKLEQLDSWGDDVPSGGDSALESLSNRLAEANNQIRIYEDRIARLQESVSDKDDFEEERQELNEKLSALEAEQRESREKVGRYEQEIAALKTQMESLEAKNQDYCATIDVLSVESTNIKTYLDRLKDEHKQKIDENNNLSENLKSLDSRNLELSKQIEEMRVYNLSVQDVEQRIQDLTATVQYKDSEIAHLNEKLESDKRELEDNVHRLQAEIQSNSQTIAELRSQCDELSVVKSALENQIAATAAINTTETPVETISDVTNNDKIVAELRAENAQMEHELQVLNDQVLKNLEIEDKIKSTVLELDLKNIEINELKNSLEQLRSQQQQATPAGADHNEQVKALEIQLSERESFHQSTINQINEQWQQTVDQKCSELADSWRQHLSIRETDFSLIENDLRQQLTELETQLVNQASSYQEPQVIPEQQQLAQSLTSSPAKSTEEQSSTASSTSPEMIDHMQKALEAQELEIVSLKEQLAIRSAQYARIAAQVDPYGEWGALTSSTRSHSDAIDANKEKGKELDSALYMLHQKDMRCEELKMEVIHLLEERDSLQSKLANSIRQIEDIRNQTGVADNKAASIFK